MKNRLARLFKSYQIDTIELDMLETQYNCPVEVTIKVLGGKWKCVILWWLRRDTKRFSELKWLIPEITPKVLTRQLRELETDRLIYREMFREAPPRVEYSLTEYGKLVRPITELMCNWGKMYLPEYQFGAQRIGGLRILIVDNNEETRLALRSTLEAREAEVFESTSVLEALEMIRQELFDAIVVDMATPESNTLISQIRQIEAQQNREDKIATIAERNRRFIALTFDEAERVRVLKAGFQVHLAKPFEPIELVAALASLAGYIN
jgi:DNA-binding HxlR family transcriptional regulator/ActR/RegA family two-component response regulator